MRRLLYDVNINFAQQRYESADIGPALTLLGETRPQPGQPDLRGFEWYYLWRLCHQERQTIEGDRTPVTSIVFSPGGQLLASSTSGGIIQLWNPATGRAVRTWPARAGVVVSSLAFSPNGKLLASGSGDGTIGLWNPSTGQCLRRLRVMVPGAHSGDQFQGRGQGVYSVAFSPDGRWLATGQEDRTARIWDVRTGQQIQTMRADTQRGVWSVAFSPDGKTLATGGDDGTARLWQTATGRPIRVLHGHSWYVYSLAFSPDGKTLATAGGDAVIQLWDPKTGRILHTLRGHTTYIYGVAFSPDGKTLASAAWDNTVRLWRTATGEEVRALRGHLSFVFCVAFSPDGRTVASGANDGVLKLWDPNREPEGHTLRGFEGTGAVLVGRVEGGDIYSRIEAHFSRDGRRIVTGSQVEPRKTAWWTRVFDAETGRKLWTRQWSPDLVPLWFDGGRYAILADSPAAQVYDLAAGRPRAVFPGNGALVNRVDLSADGSRAFTWCNVGAWGRVWNAVTGREICTLRRRDYISDGRFSPDGRWIVTASYDGSGKIYDADTGERIVSTIDHGTAKVWDAATGRLLRILDMGLGRVPLCAAFSPDGQQVVAGESSGAIFVWDARTGHVLLRLQGHKDTVKTVGYSSDGRRILSASYDHTAKVWDAVTGRELLTLRGPTSMMSAAFSPDGRRIVTSSADRTVKIWESASGGPAPRTDGER
jgi:WD40 repeat protein